MPFGAIVPFLPAIAGAIGGLFGGGGNKSQQQNNNIWGMSEGQRQGLAGMASDQMGRIYGGDPNAFWGGPNAWTVAGGGMGGPGGGDLMSTLFGGGGGGGHVSAQGYSPSFGSAFNAQASNAKADQIDLSSDIYQLAMPQWLSTMMGGRLSRQVNAQTGDARRMLEDRVRLSGHSGDLSSPASQALFGNLERERIRQIAEGRVTGELAWTMPAAERQHSARGQNAEMGTRTNIFNAGNQTDVSKFNAGTNTQVSMFNAGQSNQAGAFNANARQSAQGANASLGAQRDALQSGAARFLLGMRGEDEDRMLKRYGMAHGMNMDWQRPQASMSQGPPQPSMFDRIMGGIGGGLNLANQVESMGGWGKLFGGGGNTPGGVYPGTPSYNPYAGGQGAFPAPDNDWLFGPNF